MIVKNYEGDNKAFEVLLARFQRIYSDEEAVERARRIVRILCLPVIALEIIKNN